jgi:hypothetical protein
MPEVEERLSEAFQGFAARYGGDTSIPPRTLRALTRRRRLPRFGPAVTVAAAVLAVLLVVGAVTVIESRTHHRPQAAKSSASTPSLPPILQPGQFLGLIDPGDNKRTEQYAWIFGADGQPIKRLTRAVGVLGVTSDRRQALIQQYAEPRAGQTSGPQCGIPGQIGSPTALLSLADGSLASPFPGQPDVNADTLGGHLVAGIVIHKPSPTRHCQPPSLLVGDLATGQTTEYDLTSSVGSPRVAAISPDGRWAVIDDLQRPDHQLFYLASLNAGTARLTELPSQPGCTQSAFSAHPTTNDLTITAACGRTITITTYNPDTLAVIHTEHIADPPGATVTFAALSWNADGSQALIEGIHDNSTSGPSAYIWLDGRLTPIATDAYDLVW